MQRLFIWIAIAAIVFAASYSKTIKEFFMPAQKPDKPVTSAPASRQDDGYEQLGAELYGMAANYSNLQGKVELLKIAREKKEWFKNEDYAQIDALLEATQKDLAKAEEEFRKAKDEYTRITVQKMLEEYSRGRQK